MYHGRPDQTRNFIQKRHCTTVILTKLGTLFRKAIVPRSSWPNWVFYSEKTLYHGHPDQTRYFIQTFLSTCVSVCFTMPLHCTTVILTELGILFRNSIVPRSSQEDRGTVPFLNKVPSLADQTKYFIQKRRCITDVSSMSSIGVYSRLDWYNRDGIYSLHDTSTHCVHRLYNFLTSFE